MSATAHGRLRQLDSLRGIAALIVVICHFVLTWPAWLSSLHIRPLGPVTIAYPLYAGHEAVIFFFILSGLVLSLPYLRGRAMSYPVFLIRRILRIYGPYLVAILLSIWGAAVWHGNLGLSEWSSHFWSGPVDPRLVLQHILFLGVYDSNQFNHVIWSLIIELRVSLVFPILAPFILRLRTGSAVLFALACSIFFGFLPVRHHPPLSPYSVLETFHFMAFFVLGILVAKNLASINAWYRGLGRARVAALLFGSFVLYHVCLPLARIHYRLSAIDASDWITSLGAIGFIVVSLNSVVASRLLLSFVPAFLGRISYSLYLTHAPVLLILSFTLGRRLPPTLQFLLYVSAAIPVAFLFCVLVEEPFIRAGQRIGSRGRSSSRITATDLPVPNPSID